MPIFKAAGKLIIYAHVPKCGGSAVSQYLQTRFGDIAFNDNLHTRRLPKDGRWSRTSPQHIDAETLSHLFPAGFFDASFTIVRHPVARVVSAYHFQVEVEKRVSPEVRFSDWLDDLIEACRNDPYIYDNHARPMADIVPQGCQVFYMEHGLDALIPWFDMVSGVKDGPRVIPKVNTRSGHGAKTAKVVPSPEDLARITEFYGEDFTRFGYRPEDSRPVSPAPTLPEGFEAERDRELKRLRSPVSRLKRMLKS